MTSSKPSRPSAVWVYALDSGCGICTQQIYALLSSRFAGDMAARGIRFARSPRHADVVLLTGPLAETAREPLKRVLAAVPGPRALVAVGNCAIDGCVFHGGAHIVDESAEELDVNVEIAGCPPSPEAILDAITEAALLLTGDSSASASAAGDEDEGDESVDEDEGEESADDTGVDDTDDDADGEPEDETDSGGSAAGEGHDVPSDETRGGA